MNPEALESFHSSEIGDFDKNGLLEFHDAWGTPIRFFRWGPAFADSDKQAFDGNPDDPFDTREVPEGWFLYPLIVSAGPDKIFDINARSASPIPSSVTFPNIYNPFTHDVDVGRPTDLENKNDGSPSNGVWNHFDNIHNHRSAGGF